VAFRIDAGALKIVSLSAQSVRGLIGRTVVVVKLPRVRRSRRRLTLDDMLGRPVAGVRRRKEPRFPRVKGSDDDGPDAGTAGVRERRRPRPKPTAGAAPLPTEPEGPPMKMSSAD